VNVAKVACAYCVKRAEMIEALRAQIVLQRAGSCLSCFERQALVERTLRHAEEERVRLTLLFSKAIAKRDAEIAALRERVNGPLRLVRAGGS